MDRDSANVLTRVVVGTLLVSFTAQQPQGGLAAKLEMDHGEGIVAIMEGSALAEFKVRITFLLNPQLQPQLLVGFDKIIKLHHQPHQGLNQKE